MLVTYSLFRLGVVYQNILGERNYKQKLQMALKEKQKKPKLAQSIVNNFNLLINLRLRRI